MPNVPNLDVCPCEDVLVLMRGEINQDTHTHDWNAYLSAAFTGSFEPVHTRLSFPPLFLSLTSFSLTCSIVLRLKLHHHTLHLLCLASIEVWEHFQFLKAHSHASISRNQCTITLLCLDFFCSVWAMSILCRDSGVHYQLGAPQYTHLLIYYDILLKCIIATYKN